MLNFRLENVFDEIEDALKSRGETDIYFEDTDKNNEKIICLGMARVGKVSISYPEGYVNKSDCCNAIISFDYYVKEGEGKFDFFINNLIKLAEVRKNTKKDNTKV